jgi:hypothetical protein
VEFVVAANGLQFEASPDGVHHGKVEAALVVYDKDGKGLDWMVRQVDVDLDAAHYADALNSGVNFQLEIEVPKSGVSLRSGVYDWASHHAGTLAIPLSSIVSPVKE